MKRTTSISGGPVASAVKSVRKPRFDKEWTAMIDLLDPDRRQVMADAIRAYQLEGSEPEGLVGAELMAFALIRKIVDRRRRRREAGRRRRHSETVSAEAAKTMSGNSDSESTVYASVDAKPSLDKKERPRARQLKGACEKVGQHPLAGILRARGKYLSQSQSGRGTEGNKRVSASKV